MQRLPARAFKAAIIVDTDKLVSAMLSRTSVPSQAVAKARRLGKLIFSVENLAELKGVVSREKFDRYTSSKL